MSDCIHSAIYSSSLCDVLSLSQCSRNVRITLDNLRTTFTSRHQSPPISTYQMYIFTGVQSITCAYGVLQYRANQNYETLKLSCEICRGNDDVHSALDDIRTKSYVHQLQLKSSNTAFTCSLTSLATLSYLCQQLQLKLRLKDL